MINTLKFYIQGLKDLIIVLLQELSQLEIYFLRIQVKSFLAHLFNFTVVNTISF